MQTKIGETLYVTKFFYGKHKNPSNGKWRNRSTTCKIFKMNVPGKIVNETPKKGFFGLLFDAILGNETETKIVKVPADMTQIVEAKTRNCHGEAFVKGFGRTMAFIRAVESSPELLPHRRELVKSYEEQCPSSHKFIVEFDRQKPTEVKV